MTKAEKQKTITDEQTQLEWAQREALASLDDAVRRVYALTVALAAVTAGTTDGVVRMLAVVVVEAATAAVDASADAVTASRAVRS